MRTCTLLMMWKLFGRIDLLHARSIRSWHTCLRIHASYGGRHGLVNSSVPLATPNGARAATLAWLTQGRRWTRSDSLALLPGTYTRAGHRTGMLVRLTLLSFCTCETVLSPLKTRKEKRNISRFRMHRWGIDLHCLMRASPISNSGGPV